MDNNIISQLSEVNNANGEADETLPDAIETKCLFHDIQYYKNDIARIEATSTDMIANYDAKIKVLEEECKEFHQKEDESKKLIVELNVRADTAEAKVNALKIDVQEKTNAIMDLESKLEELSQQARNLQTEVNLKNQRIENHARQLEADKKTLSDLINRVCKAADVVVNGIIDYDRLRGKILIAEHLAYRNGKWYADEKEISFQNSDFQVCIKESFTAQCLPSSAIERVFYSSLHALVLQFTEIKFSEFKKLVTSPNSITFLYLCYVTVKDDENGSRIEIDQLLKEVPKLEILIYEFEKNEVTPETAQKLAELEPFPNLCEFEFRYIGENFDLKTFGEFIKKNHPAVRYYLQFGVSSRFFEEMVKIAHELIRTLPATELNIRKF